MTLLEAGAVESVGTGVEFILKLLVLFIRRYSIIECATYSVRWSSVCSVHEYATLCLWGNFRVVPLKNLAIWRWGPVPSKTVSRVLLVICTRPGIRDSTCQKTA